MMTPYEKTLIEDIGAPITGYGAVQIGWRGPQEIYKNSTQKVGGGLPMTALSHDLASTFVNQVYASLVTTRPIRIYRGYETAGLAAPFGKDHPSYFEGLVSQRRPGKPDGLWWTPSRPSMEIDNLKLADLHRAEHRANSAIKLEWNRLDYYLESELPVGSFVYAGRAAAQQESGAYGGKLLGGGAFQFRLTKPPDQALPWMKRYQAL